VELYSRQCMCLSRVRQCAPTPFGLLFTHLFRQLGRLSRERDCILQSAQLVHQPQLQGVGACGVNTLLRH